MLLIQQAKQWLWRSGTQGKALGDSIRYTTQATKVSPEFHLDIDHANYLSVKLLSKSHLCLALPRSVRRLPLHPLDLLLVLDSGTLLLFGLFRLGWSITAERANHTLSM